MVNTMSKKRLQSRKSLNFFINAIKKGINHIKPYDLILNNLKIDKNLLYIKDKVYDLRDYENIHLISVGKGAVSFYKGLKKIFKNKKYYALVVSYKSEYFEDDNMEFLSASHPIPDENSLRAGLRIIEYAKKNIKKNDLVIFSISGGASSMLVAPQEGLLLEDKIVVNKLLLSSGADINEINCIRKHLSAIKGGRLAELVYPAKLISLILSDITESPLENIGSGPSIGDSSTLNDVKRIIKKYNLYEKLPKSVKDFINNSSKETLPPNSKKFKKNEHFLLGDNFILLDYLKNYFESKGLSSYILTSRDMGEAKEVAKIYSGIIKEIISTNNPFKRPLVLLTGGEITVTLKNKEGKGGRNQEIVMRILEEIKDIKEKYLVLSIGTDGLDGPTDAAGAYINENTIKKIKRLDLEISKYSETNNSYLFFDKLNQLIKFGPTGTNVMDIRLFYLP